MATTPQYSWPYQGLGDPPNGPTLGQNLALAIESTVGGLDTGFGARVAALEALQPYRDRQVLTSSQPSIVFSGIPSTLRSLDVRWRTRGDAAGTHVLMLMRVNGSAAAAYAQAFSDQDGAVETNAANSGNTSQFIGYTPATATGGSTFGSGDVVFPGWSADASTTLINYLFRGIANVSSRVYTNGSGLFIAAGPYTSLTFLPASGNFVAGTDISIIGERA